MLNRNILIVFMFTGCFFSGCDENTMNEDMPSGKLIYWKTPANYYSSFDKLYNFANSMDGKLLECMDLVIPQENTFEVDRIKNGFSDRFILSRLSVVKGTSFTDIAIYTYYGILPFSKELPISSSTNSTSLGTAQVKFSNVPAYNSFVLSGSNFTTSSGSLSTRTFYYPLHSDRLNSLYLLLRTSSGNFYKVFDNLIPGQLNTLSLTELSADFSQGTISYNTGRYTSFNLSVGRYGYSDFTGGSFLIDNASSTSSTSTYRLPASFLSTTPFYTTLKGYVTNQDATTSIFSRSVPTTMALLDGTFSLSGYLPDVSYKLDLNEKADAVYMYFSHNSEFATSNKFRVTWRIWVSPAVREIKLPDIPDAIMATLRNTYGVNDLYLSQVKLASASCMQNLESDNFDEFMVRYFFGWKSPFEGLQDKNIYFYPSTTKGGSEESKIHPEISSPTKESGF